MSTPAFGGRLPRSPAPAAGVPSTPACTPRHDSLGRVSGYVRPLIWSLRQGSNLFQDLLRKRFPDLLLPRPYLVRMGSRNYAFTTVPTRGATGRPSSLSSGVPPRRLRGSSWPRSLPWDDPAKIGPNPQRLSGLCIRPARRNNPFGGEHPQYSGSERAGRGRWMESESASAAQRTDSKF